ncbi:MAG: OmpA family protein [Fibrobacteres bacterium]|nr:OmpA family protein [Fibrobacterota bacterium]
MRQSKRIFAAALALAGLAGLTARPLEAASAPRQVNIKIQNGQPAAPAPDTAALMEKARQDSSARASKARQDSLSLADARRQLDIERSKRSEMENQLLTTGLLVLDAVYFETGRTEISINSKPYLDMLAKMLTKYPKLQIEVDGHTDNVGGDVYNQNLSEGRAKAVQSYLISQAPDLNGRLAAKGFGESSPKADNRTAEGRTLNRRTELRVLNKEALDEYNRFSGSGGTAPAPTGAPAPGSHAAGSAE